MIICCSFFENFVGLLLSSIYISVFYYYTPIAEKFNVWGKIGAAGAFSAALIAYTMVCMKSCAG